jgi:hypothetical protein
MYNIGLYYISIQHLWRALMTPLNEFIQISQVIGSSIIHIPKADIRSASSIQRGIQQPPKLLSVFRISKVKELILIQETNNRIPDAPPITRRTAYSIER